ncbi:unnamed protein product [Danaus chrysippus]|uniref:(African queen) hypothetical protein n=1 Tax=Danaus chrysippus TaxID=151541 RepID=A0A8J2QQB1_9NEOP|nr:unnamed protein product [Danaus chrysippus]
MVSVLGSEEIGWGGSGPLAVIAFSFVACKQWVDQGWELEDNPVATAFEIFWMFFEPMLFSVTGAQIVIADLQPQLVLVVAGIVITCVVLPWMAKATVQAALAPVALDEVRKMTGSEEHMEQLVKYAEIVINVCIIQTKAACTRRLETFPQAIDS